MYLAFPDSAGRFLRGIRSSKYSRIHAKRFFRFRLRDVRPLRFRVPADSTNERICNLSFLYFSPNTEASMLGEEQSSAHTLQPLLSPTARTLIGADRALISAEILLSAFIRASSAFIRDLVVDKKRFGLIPFSLAATRGITFVLFSSAY